jgi:tRNA threonylcarbamoyladenosine biosynthesis protein TsaB
MNFLAIDTSTEIFSLALKISGGQLKEKNIPGKKHSEKLISEVDALLKEDGLEPEDISAIGAGIGPGSFTGIRVGLSFAITFAQVCNIPLYTFSALETAYDGKKIPAIKAYRDKFYTLDPSVKSGPERFRISDRDEIESDGAVLIEIESKKYLDLMENIYDSSDTGNWKKVEPIYIMETVYKPKKTRIERIK